jgi:hypothetical protein
LAIDPRAGMKNGLREGYGLERCFYVGVTLPGGLVQKEVNDETRPDRRERGHFGFNCLGGGGECTSQRQ